MSRKFTTHFADPKGIIVQGLDGNGLLAEGTAKPTDATAGYAPGCLFLVRAGTIGLQLYFNEGSATSCLFHAIAFGGGSLAGLTATVAEINSLVTGSLATAAEINRSSDVSTRVVTLSGSTTITEVLHSDKILLMTGTGSAFTQTLPAATGSGGRYKFIVGAVNTSNHKIIALAGDLMVGTIWACSAAETPDLGQPWISLAATSNISVTLNGTTTGGLGVGDWVECVDIATDRWAVSGMTYCNGAEATPFATS